MAVVPLVSIATSAVFKTTRVVVLFTARTEEVSTGTSNSARVELIRDACTPPTLKDTVDGLVSDQPVPTSSVNAMLGVATDPFDTRTRGCRYTDEGVMDTAVRLST